MHLQRKMVKKVPLVAKLEVTHRCNLQCRHCYIPPSSGKGEISFEKWRFIIDELYKAGSIWLCLTGGEPLVREDFFDIYRYAYKKGFILILLTNATLMDKKTAKFLREYPPFYIAVTLNGATKDTYESISGVEGSFENVMNGLKIMREYKLSLRLRTTFLTLNIHEEETIRDFYRDNGFQQSFHTIVEPRLDGSTDSCKYRLPPGKVVEILRPESAADYRRPSARDIDENSCGADQPGRTTNSGRFFRCGAGIWQVNINPFGELIFCTFLRKPAWSLFKYSLREIFYERLEEIRARTFSPASICRNCEFL